MRWWRAAGLTIAFATTLAAPATATASPPTAAAATTPAAPTATTATAPTAAGAPQTSRWYDVSCPTTTFCAAVGDHLEPGPSAFYRRPEVAVRQGGVWRRVAVTEPGAATEYGAVSCASATSCLAVGQSDVDAAAQHWDGVAWTPVPGPTTRQSLFTAVSCPAPTWCLAVGYVVRGWSLFRPFATVWNGTRWLPQVLPPTPSQTSQSFLRGVSCWAPRACVAVGDRRVARGEVAIAAALTGTTWQPWDAALFPNARYSTLDAVSCGGPGWCTAVGSVHGADASRGVSAGYRTGTWAAAGPLPAIAGDPTDIGCPSTTLCLVTGRLDSPSDPLGFSPTAVTVAADGAVTTTTPVDPPLAGTFAAVSCRGVDDCVAVGHTVIRNLGRAAWNGPCRSWRTGRGPRGPGSPSDQRTAVTDTPR